MAYQPFNPGGESTPTKSKGGGYQSYFGNKVQQAPSQQELQKSRDDRSKQDAELKLKQTQQQKQQQFSKEKTDPGKLAAKFVSSLPGKAIEFGKGVGGVFQSVARAPEQVVKSAVVQPAVNALTANDKSVKKDKYGNVDITQKNQKVFDIPGTEGLAKLAYGAEPMKTYQTQSSEIEKSAESSKNKTIKSLAKLAPFIQPVLAATDATAFSGTGALAKHSFNGTFKEVLSGGAKMRLESLSKNKKPLPELTEKETKGMLPKKINVLDSPSTEKVGVTTPVKAGIKDISTTDTVQVKTPNVMSDETYSKKFNSLSKSYDKATKELENLPPLKQKVAAESIEKTHTQALDKLDAEYKTPTISEKPSKVQSINKMTTNEKTTGGKPQGYINSEPVAPKTSVMPTNKLTSYEGAPDVARVEKYKADIQAGKPIDPIIVKKDSSGNFSIQAGRHKFEAYKQLGIEHVPTIDATVPNKISVTSNPDTRLSVEDSQKLFDKNKVETPQAKKDKVIKSRVYERMKAEHPDLTDDVSSTAINLKEQSEKAVELIAKDKNKAYRVALGTEELSDQTSTAVNIALSEKALAEGNMSLYSHLTKSRSLAQTRRGQEIVSEKASISDNSTARYVKELINSRLEKLGKNYLGDLSSGVGKISKKEKAMTRIDKEVNKAQKTINSKNIDVAQAQSLIDSLMC